MDLDFCILLLLLSTASLCSGEWKNKLDGPLDFKCPPGQYLNRWISKHDNGYEDRKWDFECKSGMVGTTCQWSREATAFDIDMDFNCPSNYIMAGAKSVHNNYYEDRKWQFYCCRITIKPGKNCFTTGFINNLDNPMDHTLQPGTAITGVLSWHDNSMEDRRWKLKLCYFATCVAKKVKILDKLTAERTGQRIVGMTSSKGCSSNHQYSLNLVSTDSVTESVGIAITKGSEFTFSTEISVSVDASVGFLGSGSSVTMGISAGHETTSSFSTEKSKETSTSRDSEAETSIEYPGPGAAIILGEVTEYTIKRNNVNADVYVVCDDGKSFTKRQKVTLSSTSYGKTHFSHISGQYNPGKCLWSDYCIKNIEGSNALQPKQLFQNFQQCFADGKGKVAK